MLLIKDRLDQYKVLSMLRERCTIVNVNIYNQHVSKEKKKIQKREAPNR